MKVVEDDGDDGGMTANGRTALARAGVAVVFALTSAGEARALATPSVEIEPTDVVDAITPVDGRYLDTRPDGTTVDGREIGAGRLAAGDTVRLPLRGRPGVTGDARSVFVNLVAVDPLGPGHLTAFDCSDPAPDISNLNYVARRTRAALTLVSMPGDDICITTHASTHLVVDVVASGVGPGGHRVVDTRLGVGRPRLTAGEIWPLPSSGVPGADLIVNLTAVDPADRGVLRIAPCAEYGEPGAPGPAMSILNLDPARPVSNLAWPGSACVSTDVDVDLIVDVLGTTGCCEIATPDSPPRQDGWESHRRRVLDTRPSGNRLGAGETILIPPVSPFEPFGTSTSWLLNLTVVDPGAAGHLVAYACRDVSDPPPSWSTMNYVAGDVVAHQTIVNRSPGESVCVWTMAATDLVVDRYGTIANEHALVVRTASSCIVTDHLTSGPGPSNVFPGSTPPDPWLDYAVRGTGASATVSAVGPPGWTIDVTSTGRSTARVSWVADPASPSGAYPIATTVTDDAGRSITLTSDVSYLHPDDVPDVPVVVQC